MKQLFVLFCIFCVVVIFATDSPSKNPSQSPSKNPSRNPSKNPSRNPSKNPSKNPSQPSRSPTKNPSRNPSVYNEYSVLIFRSNETVAGGNLSSTNADLICERNRADTCLLDGKVRAMVSYDGRSIRSAMGLNTTIPVIENTGFYLLASTWLDFMDGLIGYSLHASGINDVWTFSTRNGFLLEESCGNGTENTTGGTGRVRVRSYLFLESGTTAACYVKKEIWCACESWQSALPYPKSKNGGHCADPNMPLNVCQTIWTTTTILPTLFIVAVLGLSCRICKKEKMKNVIQEGNEPVGAGVVTAEVSYSGMFKRAKKVGG